MKKPLQVLHIIPSLSQGGAEGVLVSVVTGTKEFRHSIATYLPLPATFEPPRDIVVHQVGSSSPDAGSKIGRWIRGLTAGLEVARIARRERPDVIVGWLFPSFWISLPARFYSGSKLIWSTHCAALDPNGYSRGLRVAMWTWGRLSRFVHTVHYVSGGSRAWHEREGFPRDRGILVGNGIDVERFKPDPNRVRNGLRTLLMPARFVPEKGHATLFQAARFLFDRGRQLRILCVGSGTDGDEFKAMADEHGARDLVIGLGARTDIENFYREADVVVLCSTHENAPLVILEALASGVPVVSTNVGNVSEIIGDLGRIAASNTPEALATAVEEVLNDENLRLEACRRGPTFIASEHGMARMVEGWRAMLQKVAANG